MADPMRALLAARTAAFTGGKPGSSTNLAAAANNGPPSPNPFGATAGQRTMSITAPGAAASRPAGSYGDDATPRQQQFQQQQQAGRASTPSGAGTGAPSSSSSSNSPHPAWVSAGLLTAPDWSTDVTSDECGSGCRLKGEVPVFTDVEAYYRSPSGHRVAGTLGATTYQLRFTPHQALPASMRHLPPSFFCVPVASVRKVERVQGRGRDAAGGAFLIDIICKDVRVLTLGFSDEAMADKMASHIKLVAFPPKIDYVQAFADQPRPKDIQAGTAERQPGWDIYSAAREVDRQGVLRVRHPRTGEALFRVTEMNRDYVFSPTYPALLVLPERASDAHMQAVGAFRSKARVPAMTWMHPANKTTLWRCSQPKVGMGGNTCAQDEQLISMIREANVYSKDGQHVPLLLADCRPKVNAMANKAGGGGYEVYAGTQLEFMGIQNIHVVRDSHRKLEALALHATPNDVNWTAGVHDSGWLYHTRTVLSAAMFVAEAMHRKGQQVLVHCSDGWDRTAQVCGLAQVMLDPYFRTARGYMVLIAKEWCSFGHKFNDRAGHREEKDDGDISPVFLQFLDATWQLVRLYPHAFEFDHSFLLLIAHHVYSCRFGTFLCNNDRERQEAQLALRTPSLWGYLESRADLYRSPVYDPSAGDVLLPHPAGVLRHVTVWTDWFMRWSPYPSAPASNRMEKYSEAVYNRAPVAAAMLPRPAVAPASAAAAVPVASVAAVAAVSPAASDAASAAAAAVVDVVSPASDDSASVEEAYSHCLGGGTEELEVPAAAAVTATDDGEPDE